MQKLKKKVKESITIIICDVIYLGMVAIRLCENPSYWRSDSSMLIFSVTAMTAINLGYFATKSERTTNVLLILSYIIFIAGLVLGLLFYNR